MRVLGIDTSGYANAVGVTDGGQVLADFTFEARADSLQKIMANIDSTLKSARLTLEDIDGFGVGLGPGSWTGIRVGVTVAKILAYCTSKPVAGVPTLEVLAYGTGNSETPVCAIISTGAGDTVYAAFYRTRNGEVARDGDYYVGDIAGLARMVKEPTVLIGAEAMSYGELICREGSLGSSIKAIEGVPRGAVVAILAARRLERGESDDVLSLTPLYLKESTARAFRNRYKVRAQSKGGD